jgi:omega-amidase
MSNSLRLALLQTDPVWQDVGANIQIIGQWLDKIPSQTDLAILPEMFLTGFSMDVSKTALEMNGKEVKWLVAKAVSKNIMIVGSLTILDEGKFYNRLLMVMPSGDIQWYDKRHLFRMGEEHHYFSPGNQLLVAKFNDWNIRPLVCYDLRFPVWSRNTDLIYDLLIYVANWPESRHDAFVTLLKARAIENQCYVAAVNRVGMDGQGVKHAGGSVVIDPKGMFMTKPSQSKELIDCTISLDELKKFREKFPAYLDADSFEIK